LLALKIIAAHTLHTNSTSSRAQMLSTLQQYASSLSQLLPHQGPPAGHDDAASAAGDAGTQLASSLAQMSLDSSAGQAALSGQELQWFASSMHNLGVELLSKQYQQHQELQQQLAAAVLKLSCQACLCQMQAPGGSAEHLPEVIKKAKAQLGCLKKAGRQVQLVREADVVMLQLWKVSGPHQGLTVMLRFGCGTLQTFRATAQAFVAVVLMWWTCAMSPADTPACIGLCASWTCPDDTSTLHSAGNSCSPGCLPATPEAAHQGSTGGGSSTRASSSSSSSCCTCAGACGTTACAQGQDGEDGCYSSTGCTNPSCSSSSTSSRQQHLDWHPAG
jgi:hypothetical protein